MGSPSRLTLRFRAYCGTLGRPLSLFAYRLIPRRWAGGSWPNYADSYIDWPWLTSSPFLSTTVAGVLSWANCRSYHRSFGVCVGVALRTRTVAAGKTADLCSGVRVSRIGSGDWPTSVRSAAIRLAVVEKSSAAGFRAALTASTSRRLDNP